MGKISDMVKRNRVLISDGAWGTSLQQKGLLAGECPEEWNISHRSDVLEIARNYIYAGSDMIQTNSFGGSRFKLAHYGLDSKAEEINRAAAEISREAAGDKLVIASLGPTGKILMMGDVSEEQLYEGFREQAVALEAGGADAACIETMAALDEALCAVKAVQENTNLEIICTFTFDKTSAGDFRTMMGVSPSSMTTALIEAGAEIIGSNCGNGMEQMICIVKEIRNTSSDIPVLIHANAGLPVVKDGNNTFPETPEDMAGLAPKLAEVGANIIGGCCGTTPAHIAAIAGAVQ
ncbi:MAG: methionine synthase [Chitinivibrionales bacterium]|nr:methionine synthase [Chitinivibrionales bacterium]